MTDARGRLLVAALGFAWLPAPPRDRALWALRTWLDSWSGIGRIPVGMARQGFDLQLTQYDERGWRATLGRRAVWSVKLRPYTTSSTAAPSRPTWSAGRTASCCIPNFSSTRRDLVFRASVDAQIRAR
jgi:hypothetical protein